MSDCLFENSNEENKTEKIKIKIVKKTAKQSKSTTKVKSTKNAKSTKSSKKRKSIKKKKKRDEYYDHVETFNVEKLKIIISNFEKLKPQLRWREKYDNHDPLVIVKRYLEKSNNGEVVVTYRQKNGVGRLYAMGSLSLQSIPREIRHTIAKEYYVDGDIENAHPVILQFLCEKNGFECPELDLYIKSREDLLKRLTIGGRPCDRGEAKQIYLSITNGGIKDFRRVDNSEGHLLSYKNEMIKLHELFSEKYSDEFKKVKKKRERCGKTYNHEAGLMNYLMCDFENKMLLDIHQYLGCPKNCVLVFDGIMLLKKNENGCKIEYDIEGCSKFLKKKYGININLKFKAMDEELDLSGLEVKDIVDTPESIFNDQVGKSIEHVKDDTLNDNTLSKMFYDLNRGDIKMTDDVGGFYWDREKKIWEPLVSSLIMLKIADQSTKYNMVGVMEKTRDKYIDDDRKDVDQRGDSKETSRAKHFLNFIQSAKGVRDIFVFAKALFRDTKFLETVNRNHDLFPMREGKILNLETGEIRERRKEDLFTLECDVTYIPEEEWSTEDKKTNDKFINQILMDDPKYIAYTKQKMGSYLSGRNNRDIDINHGIGRNGKSSIINALKVILGDFMGFIGKNVIVHDPKAMKTNKGSGHTSNLIPIEGKRLIATQELESGDVINAEMMKKIASSDPIEGVRECYGKVTRTINPFGKLVVQTNNLPKFDSQDQAVVDRLCFNPYFSRFLNKEGLELEKKRGKYDPKKYKYYEADNQIIDKYKKAGRPIDILFSWMVQGCKEFYALNGEGIKKPPIVLKYIQDKLDDNDVVGRWVNEFCDIKNASEFDELSRKDKKKYTTSVGDLFYDFSEWAKESGCHKGITKLKFSKYLDGNFKKKKQQRGGNAFERITLKSVGDEDKCDFS